MNYKGGDEKIILVMSRRIKTALFEADMSCAALARVIGSRDATVYRIVSGKAVPMATTLKKIADALNVSTDWLLGRTDEKEVQHG